MVGHVSVRPSGVMAIPTVSEERTSHSAVRHLRILSVIYTVDRCCAACSHTLMGDVLFASYKHGRYYRF